jgi:hypothetical protein
MLIAQAVLMMVDQQATVSRSSTEGEYKFVANGMAEEMWILCNFGPYLINTINIS